MQFIKETWNEFWNDNVMVLSAAVAFYAGLSFAPLLILLMWAASVMGQTAQDELTYRVVRLMGDQAGQAVRTVLSASHERPESGTLAGVISIGLLLFAATGVFVQVQQALNVIWDVEPRSRRFVWAVLRKRLLSLLMMVLVGALLMASMIFSTIVSAIDAISHDGTMLQVLNFGVSVVIFTLIFAAVYWILPDARVPWRVIWTGAFATGLFMTVGKLLVSAYMGYSSLASRYGAAGSIIVLLVWAYYSAIIFFLGAEIAQVWARRHHERIDPTDEAVRTHRKRGLAEGPGAD